MGDRANVVAVEGESPALYLYTHWSGWELGETLAEALGSPQGRARWGDGAYLNRIIFSRMTRGQEDGETGFGISTYPCDNDSYAYLVIDHGKNEVRLCHEGPDLVTPIEIEGFELRFPFEFVAENPKRFGRIWQAVANDEFDVGMVGAVS